MGELDLGLIRGARGYHDRVPRGALVGIVALTALPLCWFGSTAGASSAPTSLVVPQGAAFSILRYDCGGIREHAYATGFDMTRDRAAGYPTGDVYLWTVCNGSGKGGPTTTHSAWTSDTWDLTGALLSISKLGAAPTVDPSFSATDSLAGNEVYNTTNFNCTSQTGTLPTACLQLAPSFTPRPRVTGMSAMLGPATGGTSVTIAGDGFTGATAVKFGATPAANYSVTSDTLITAVSPPESPGEVEVSVVSIGGTSFPISGDQFTFYGHPSVTKVSPDRGPIAGGYYVTVTGTHLLGATSVSDGDTPTAFHVVNDTTMLVYVIPGDSLGDSMDIVVTTPGGTSAITSADQFTYGPVASLTLSPTKARPGSTIKVIGHNFASDETVTVVYVTGKASPKQVKLCSGTTSGSGTIRCTGRLPRRSTAGARGFHEVTATGAAIGDSASASIKLT